MLAIFDHDKSRQIVHSDSNAERYYMTQSCAEESAKTASESQTMSFAILKRPGWLYEKESLTQVKATTKKSCHFWLPRRAVSRYNAIEPQLDRVKNLTVNRLRKHKNEI